MQLSRPTKSISIDKFRFSIGIKGQKWQKFSSFFTLECNYTLADLCSQKGICKRLICAQNLDFLKPFSDREWKKYSIASFYDFGGFAVTLV